MPKPKKKEILEAFWGLSRVKQEAFLKGLYDLSPENKDLFRLWLMNDFKTVTEDLKKEVQKETVNRIGKFKKLRLSKINEIIRNAEKCALPVLSQVELRQEVWMGMVSFVISKRWLPERYEVAAARHLDVYLTMVKDHVLERSEQDEILKRNQQILYEVFEKGFYLPHVSDVYVKHFDG